MAGGGEGKRLLRRPGGWLWACPSQAIVVGQPSACRAICAARIGLNLMREGDGGALAICFGDF